jgi:hypothetical protein
VIDHRAALRILIEMAPKLREAGIESFSIDENGGLADVRLRPHDPPPPAPPKEPDNQFPPANPLDDADTFGGAVPKRRPIFERDEEEQR